MASGGTDGGRTDAGNAHLLLDDFEEGRTEFETPLQAAALDLSDRNFDLSPRVLLRLSVQRFLQTFTVKGTVSFEIGGECCRCLAAVQKSFEAEVEVLIQRREVGADLLEAAEEEDDVEIVDPGARVVDLTGRVRDAVALEWPMRVYCREDCKGLCSSCGHDLNEGACGCSRERTDPRWEALEGLAAKQSRST
ncbi:MAG: DUF177 domain-containing protein [Gemmatimonadetes bacterium]|nr:DUF177 domain-containing protein [Gemmatimonadota bacterium]